MALVPAKSGDQFEGRAPVVAALTGRLLRLDAQRQFVFLAHPLIWDVIGNRLVPRLRQFFFEPGVSGVEERKGQFDGDATHALADLERNGWKIIKPQKVIAFGAEKPHYCLAYDGYRGPVHIEAWRRPIQIGNRVDFEHDEKGYVNWLVSLIETEQIAPCSETTKKGLKLRLTRAMRKRFGNDRNAIAVANGEIYEQKLRVLDGRFVVEPDPEPAASSELPPVTPDAPPARSLEAMLAEILAGQRALVEHQNVLSARLERLESKPETPKSRKSNGSEKEKAPAGENPGAGTHGGSPASGDEP